jgi:uncharacterized protein (DUF2345 family)
MELIAGANLSATVTDNTSVMSGKKVDVVGHADRVHVASQTGPGVEVQGASLHFGETAPRAPQQPTEHVFVRSKRHVSMTTDIDPAREHRADGIHLESHDQIAARSHKHVTVEAAQKITLKIADKEIELVVDASGNIVLHAKNASIEVSDRGGVGIAHQNTEVFRGRVNRVTVGTSPSDRLEIAPGLVTLKGSSVKIG